MFSWWEKASPCKFLILSCRGILETWSPARAHRPVTPVREPPAHCVRADGLCLEAGAEYLCERDRRRIGVLIRGHRALGPSIVCRKQENRQPGNGVGSNTIQLMGEALLRITDRIFQSNVLLWRRMWLARQSVYSGAGDVWHFFVFYWSAALGIFCLPKRKVLV